MNVCVACVAAVEMTTFSLAASMAQTPVMVTCLGTLPRRARPG